MAIQPRDDLPTPPANLGALSDGDRKIGKVAVYDLSEIKAHVTLHDKNGLRIVTEKARDDIQHDLRWQISDICGFIKCLEPYHYRYSEWVYGSQKAKVAFPADVYVMGYNRIKQTEWPQVNPWNYFKFSFSSISNTIQIFSLHTEQK